MTNRKRLRKMLSKKSKNYLAVITTLFSNLLILLTIWLIRKYDNVTIDQFLYQMKSSATGVDHSLGISASFWVVLLSILFTYLEVELYLYFLIIYNRVVDKPSIYG